MYTKGTWRTYADFSGEVVRIVVSEQKTLKTIALFPYKEEGLTTEEKEANAQLIVAAPDLYEACREVLEFVQEVKLWHQVNNIELPTLAEPIYYIQELKKALAKAKVK